MNRDVRVLAQLTSAFAISILALAPCALADEVSGAEVEVSEEPVSETIVLISGDKVTGVIVSHNEHEVVMDHPTLGRITIPNADIAEESDEEEKPGLFGTRFLHGTTRTLGFGASGATGNSESVGLSATFSITGETERNRGDFRSAYLFASQSGSQTQNQFFAGYLHDFLFPGSKFFLFGNTRFDYDEFRSWDERITAGAGAGYEIWKTERIDLIGRLGFGFSKTFGSLLSSDDDVKPEMLVGIEFGWTIVEGVRFTASNLYAPNLQDISEFRDITNVGIQVDIGVVRGLSLNAGIMNEYISDTPFPNEKNDLRYITTLAYDL